MAGQLTGADKAAVRGIVFGHLAGIALAPIVKALAERGVFDLLCGADWIGVDRITEDTGGNRGYIQVALRLLASHGWLRRMTDDDGRLYGYSVSPEGRIALAAAPPLYAQVAPFLQLAMFLQDFLFSESEGSVAEPFEALVTAARNRWGIELSPDPVTGKVQERIRTHLDGLLIGPAMVALGRGEILSRLENGPVPLIELPGDPRCLSLIFDLLAIPGWVERNGDDVHLTATGSYAAQIAPSYGVTVSYLPTFAGVGTLLFGNARIPRVDQNGVELHVDRAMNVWGSGGAHKTYFQKVDEIMMEIFNRPLEQQPRGICDMGCGDGALLEHLYTVIKERTARGRALEKYPVILVGADFNKVARRVTTQTLRNAGIKTFHVIHGDINRPAQLAGSLEELGHDIHDFLHVRSFLDHNRPYLPPAEYVDGSRKPRTTGAFAHLGEDIPADELEENLVRHLRRWAPFVGRFGLLLLELHTLPPEVTAANLTRTPAVAYDATHGFSDQYLVELPVFLECAGEAGLVADARFAARFPPSELATVSVNFFAFPRS
jgi:hypothetical protein